ncbi:MAG: sigma 54-interacting transcriptional regulator [Anaeromyxobacteraceae bacterium]
MPFGPIALLAALIVALAPGVARPEVPPPEPTRRTVVVLYSISQDVAGLHELAVALTDGLQKGSPDPLDIYSEYTGLDRFTGTAYEDALLALYREKYRSRKVDLLVVVGPDALDFVTRRNFLPGVPVVTSYVARRVVDEARLRRPELTGALPAQNVPPTLHLMLSLYPATRRIDVVLGASEYERRQAETGKRLFSGLAKGVELAFLTDLSLEEIERRVAGLPDDALVLYGSLLQDAAGRDFTSNLPVERVSAASRRPVFGLIHEDMGSGILGGELVSMAASGKVAADLGLRVLRGEPPASIPLVPDAGLAPMFDWRQMQRWGIPESSLPPGSLVLFRTPSAWQQHGRAIGIGLGVIGLETLLVAGLVLQLRRRRRAERELALAETRYRTVADFTHDWEFWQHPDGTFEYVSPACERLSGHPPADFLDPGLLESLVLEDDRAAWRAYQAAVLAGEQRPPIEFRIRTRAGEVLWVRQANNPVSIGPGRTAGTRGSIGDVNARKLGELALQKAYEEIAALKDELEAENTYYREKIQAVEGSSELLGQSDPMKYLLYRIRQVAPSATTVLIQGETGTGKELVAEAIHALGPRKDRPLVKVNCAALPPSLAESELFGHEKGAFTGAHAQRKGRFELADGATLFLDEVGELSPELQAKLLRVLQDGTFQRVGGDDTLRVDVRVVAATNRNLSREVATGRFREDLWYRLNVFPITVPPLRQRRDDIPLLARAFVERTCARLSRPVLEIPRSVVTELQAHDWPGNVRELHNVIEQAVLVSDAGVLRLPERLVPGPGPGQAQGPGQGPGGFQTLEEMERAHILQALEATSWKLEGREGAAAVLGLKPSTLRSRMLKLDIRRPAE